MERAPRGYTTLLEDGQDVVMVFDTGDLVAGRAHAFTDPEGFRVGQVVFDQPKGQAVFRGMRANSSFAIRVAGRMLLQGGLDGFSASYLKVVDECGFTGEGVLD